MTALREKKLNTFDDLEIREIKHGIRGVVEFNELVFIRSIGIIVNFRDEKFTCLRNTSDLIDKMSDCEGAPGSPVASTSLERGRLRDS